MTTETTGDRVRRLRNQHGYSTYRLAEIVGCRHTTIDHIENNVYGKSKYLPAIARALSTTTEYLLEGDQVKAREEPGGYRARLTMPNPD
jgi:transcriptional regulator with XRE-family HTH domain